ncbi:porin [Halomonas sp. HL-93]|uniref:porin n=1 Tax=Halomonas sp. HL-93 TaxID=1666906 RepID=UPI0006DA15C1|nr:porin [Halomonas sp. HL-93]KPQ22476.1 MAG: Outer membrane protein (porin) [Halomonas sp. HL-93]SBR49935.1 outer membrane insertion C-terminal signal [Halomonas sp. HL-93]
MKKTLLATAIAGTMAASGAQAATVYDQDGTSLDLYGRLAYAVQTGGPEGEAGTKSDGSEFVDLGSRFGFIANHEVTSDLSTFARMEFRGKADARNGNAQDDDSGDVDFGGFDTIRNTYVGVKSDSWGAVQVGNFDSIMYQNVTVIQDVPESDGATNIDFGNVAAHGDSIQYSSPVMEGFQTKVAVKHLSGNSENVSAGDDTGSTTSWHAGVSYEWEDLYLGAAYNQAKQEGENDTASYDGEGAKQFSEDLWGVVAQYGFTDNFSARISYQEAGDITASQDEIVDETTTDAGVLEPSYEIDNLVGVGATYDYGMGEIYGDYYHVEMIDNRVDDQNRWVLGANYRFSEPMYVFAEAYQEDSSTSSDDSLSENFRSLDDDVQYTVGVRYDF